MGKNLVWIDLEMTGLDPDRMVILEIATVVTSDSLEIIAEGPNIAIYYPEDVLANMEKWSRDHHSASGLLDRVEKSDVDREKAEKMTLDFITTHCERDESPLCGNSVWQDRRFLAKQMPDLESFLHYRIIDVSSVKELAMRWYPSLPLYKKKKSHLALQDIHESINELRYYRKKIFKGLMI